MANVGWTVPPITSSPRNLSPLGRAFPGPVPGVLAHGSGYAPQSTSQWPPAGSFQSSSVEAWWQPQPRAVTVPRHIIERLRAVHLAQLQELSLLRVKVGESRNWPLLHHQTLDRIRDAKRKEGDLTTKVAVAIEDVSQTHETVNLMRYNCIDLEAQLRACEAREAQLEERFSQRATRSAESESGAIMSLEVSVVGIDLTELHDLEAVRLITRPMREAAAQSIGLSRAASSCSLSEGVGRLAMHFRLPPDLRASPERFRTFKKHFVEAKQSGEFRARLEEALIELEDEFGTRVAVRSVSQPVLLDGAKIIVPEGAGALGFVPEGHPPSLVTLWQVQPGSWAQKAGIQSGDTLLWLNDQAVTEIDVRVLADRMRNRRPLSLYIARPPGVNTQKAKEDVAARKIQDAFRKKLAKERGREARYRMELAHRTREQERQAASASAAGQRKRNVDDEFERRRMEKLQGMADSPGSKARRQMLPEEGVPTSPQAGFRGDADHPELSAFEQRIAGVEARVAGIEGGRSPVDRVGGLEGMDHLLSGLGDYLDQGDKQELEYITFDLKTSERKLGLKTAGEPPKDRVYVADVTPGSWADENEVEVGDEVLMLGGKALEKMKTEDFYKALKVRPVELQFQRGVPVGASPDGDRAARQAAATKIQAGLRGRQARAEVGSKKDRLEQQRLDEAAEAERRKQVATIANATEDRWLEYVVKPSVKSMGWLPAGMAPDRIIIESIEEDSWAEHVGMQTGDELMSIAGQEISTLDEKSFAKAFRARPLELLMYRHGGVVGDGPDIRDHIGDDDGLDGLLDKIDTKKKQYTLIADESAQQLGFAPGVIDPPNPVYIEIVTKGGWAAIEGVKQYDVFLTANGQQVCNLTEKKIVKLMQVRPLELTFQRGSGVPPKSAASTAGAGGGVAAGADARPGGIGSQYELTAYEGDQFLGLTPGAMPPDYVFVHLVEPGLWADINGVAVGDGIIAVNGQPTGDLSTAQFQKLLLPAARPVTLLLEQGSGQPIGTGEAGAAIAGLASDIEGTPFELVVKEGVVKIGFRPAAFPPDPVVLAQIDPGEWAEKHKLLENIDTLVAVNGQDVSAMSQKKLTQALLKRPVRLTFVRSRGPAPDAPDDDGGGAEHEIHWGGGGDDAPGEEFEVVAYEGEDWLGFKPSSFPPDEVYITSIDEDDSAWAYYNQLAVDDQIFKVNGVLVTEMNKKEFKQAIKDRPLSLTIWRAAVGDYDPNTWDDEATARKKSDKEKKRKKLRRVDSDGAFEQLLEAAGLDEDSDDPDVVARKKAERKYKKATLKADAETGSLGWDPGGIWPPEAVTIVALEPFGFAESKKFKVGDVLVSVNDVDIKDITKQELKALMKERPVTMSFERKVKKKKANP